MSSVNSIASEKLFRLIGTPKCPAIIDVRADDDFSTDPRLVPGSVRRPSEAVGDWAAEFRGQSVVVICHKGLKLSHGVAAFLREAGASAEVLEDGFAGWARSGLSLVVTNKLLPRNAQGRTVWVTRERPKIDRIACPWLIRRFVDPDAVFLFVAPSEVSAVAEQFGGAAFDIEGVFWSHRGEACTFDVMIEEFGLRLARAPAAGDDRPRRRYRSPRSRAGSAWPSRSFARSVAHVRGRSRTARRRDDTLRCVLSLELATRRAKRTTGPPTRRGPDMTDTLALSRDESRERRSRRFDRRSLSRLAPRRGAELRRPSRTNRGDAPHSRRRKKVGVGEPLHACAQLLHACCPVPRRSSSPPISAG